MIKLQDLPNIGVNLAEKLKQAGIQDVNELRSLGSENALIRLHTLKNSGACINMLYALEGAIQGIRWHHLDTERKKELRTFYAQLMLSND